MDCPFCGAELEYEDTWFNGLPRDGDKQGEIYRCPNHEGFQSEEEARAYNEENDSEFKDDWWEEIVCYSATHHVSGSFYTDKNGNLHNGYPC